MTFRVVKHFNVIEHILPTLVSCVVDLTPNSFAFEQLEEALGDGVVFHRQSVRVIDRSRSSGRIDWRLRHRLSYAESQSEDGRKKLYDNPENCREKAGDFLR